MYCSSSVTAKLFELFFLVLFYFFPTMLQNICHLINDYRYLSWIGHYFLSKVGVLAFNDIGVDKSQSVFRVLKSKKLF